MSAEQLPERVWLEHPGLPDGQDIQVDRAAVGQWVMAGWHVRDDQSDPAPEPVDEPADEPPADEPPADEPVAEPAPDEVEPTGVDDTDTEPAPAP